MNRGYYILKSAIKRMRGVFPISKGIPFLINLGRSLLFNSENLTTTDSVGDETRTLQPDYCITSDEVGGGAYFSTPILNDVTKWAVGFRMSDFEAVGNDVIIGGQTNNNIWLNRTDYLGYRDSSSTFYLFDGTGNTVEVLGSSLSTFDIFMYSDGTNIYAWVNGEYKGYITPSDTTIYVNRLINGYTTGGISYYIPKGDHYDYRLYDLTSKSATEITDYFDEQGAKFHHNKMEVSDNWKFHRYLMNEKGLAACLDSGNVDTKNNGVYFYDDVTNPVDYLHNPTLYPSQLQNFHNKEGWNKAAKFESGFYIEYDDIFIEDGDTFEIILNKEGSTTQDLLYYDSDNRLRFVLTNQIYWELFQVSDDSRVFKQFIFSDDFTSFVKLSCSINGNNATITRSDTGESKTITHTEPIYFKFNSLSKNTSTPLLGTVVSLKKNGVYLDELNGSTTGTPTNVDFNKVLIPNLPNQETDIFGRTPLYKGIAKYNSKAYGGVVGDFTDINSEVLVNESINLNSDAEFTYIVHCIPTTFNWGSNHLICGNIYKNRITVNSGRDIRLYASGAGASVALSSLLVVQNQLNKISVRGKNKPTTGFDARFGLDGNYEDNENLTYSLSDTLSLFRIGKWDAADYDFDGYITLVQIYDKWLTDEQIENLSETPIHQFNFNNNLINVINGNEANSTNFNFIALTNYTPQSTTDMLKYGGVKRPYKIFTDLQLFGTSGVIDNGDGNYTFNLNGNDNSVLYKSYINYTLNKNYKIIIDNKQDFNNSFFVQRVTVANIAIDDNGININRKGRHIITVQCNRPSGAYPQFSIADNGEVKDLDIEIEYILEELNEPLYIPKPQFDLLPTDIRLPANGLVNYPYCKVDFDPIVWDTYKSYTNIASLDFATDTLAGISGTATNAVTFDGYSDVLSFWADGNNLTHFLRYTNTILQDNNYRVITQIYLPSTNTNVDEVNVSNGYSDDGYMAITDTDKWVSVNLEINDTHSQSTLEIYLYSGGVLTFAGANSSTDDIIYVRNLIVDEVIEHIDYDSRSEQLIANPTLESNDDGYTVTNSDEITTQGRNTTNPISGVADYKLAVTTAGTNDLYPIIDIDYNTTPQLLGKKVLISFDYKVNSGTCILALIKNGNTGNADNINETLSGSGTYTHIMDCDDPDDNNQTFLRLFFKGINEFEIQLDNINVNILETSNLLGHIPHLIFNKLCITGNGMNLPEIFNEDMYEILDLTNPYTWTTEELINFLSYVNVAYEGFLYADILYDANDNPISIKGLYVYDRKLTDIEDEYNESIDFDYINLEQQAKYPNDVPMYVNDDDENLPILIP